MPQLHSKISAQDSCLNNEGNRKTGSEHIYDRKVINTESAANGCLTMEQNDD